MKRFFTIYEFELKSYLKNKSFTITTILLVILLFAATFLPRFFDMTDMLGIEKTSTESGDKTDTSDETKTDEKDKTKIGVVDETGILGDMSVLKQTFEDTDIVAMNTEKELKKAVKVLP